MGEIEVTGRAPADHLVGLRESLGWTQAEAAAHVGRSSNHYAGYEQGRVPVPLFVVRLLEQEVALRGSPNNVRRK